MHSFPSLALEPRLSPMLLVGGGLSHVLAGAAVLVSNIPLGVKAGLIAAIGLSLAWFGWRYGNRAGRGFIARIELLDGRWRLETGDGRVYRVQLTGGYAHVYCLILHFRLENGWSQALTLLPDAADPEALRELRVWLRTRRDQPEPP